MSKSNKTENEFRSMTAGQGNQSFFFSNVITAFYRVFLMQFDTNMLFHPFHNINGFQEVSNLFGDDFIML